MKNYLLLTLTFLLSFLSFSQELTIELNNKRLNTLPSDFSIDTIIDVRKDQHCIGYGYMGFNKTKGPVYLAKPFREYLNDFFIDNIHAQYDGQHIIRINRLFVFEKVYYGMEYSGCVLNLSYIVKNGNHFAEEFQASSTVISSSSIDVTTRHDNDIIQALNTCFQEYFQRNNQQKLTGLKDISSEDLYQNPLDEPDYLILTRTSTSRGIYHTFYDFRDDTPDTNYTFTIEYDDHKDEVFAVIKGADGNTINDVWGFNDGQRDYINIEYEFYPLSYENGTYQFMYDAPGNVANLFMFGLIGGLISSLTEIANTQKVPYELDLTSGSFFSKDEHLSCEISTNVILLSSRFNDKYGSVEVQWSNSEVKSLVPGSYYILKVGSDEKTLKITLYYSGIVRHLDLEPIPFKEELYLLRAKRNRLIIDQPTGELRNEMIKDMNEGKYQRID